MRWYQSREVAPYMLMQIHSCTDPNFYCFSFWFFISIFLFFLFFYTLLLTFKNRSNIMCQYHSFVTVIVLVSWLWFFLSFYFLLTIIGQQCLSIQELEGTNSINLVILWTNSSFTFSFLNSIKCDHNDGATWRWGEGFTTF